MTALLALLIAAAAAPDAGVPAAPEPRELAGTGRASLCAELKKSDRELAAARAKLDEDREALAAERGRLEALAAEIAKAREALREETARLDALVKRAQPAPEPRAAPEAPAAGKPKQDLDDLARAVKAMHPDQAATLVSRLDRDLGARLLAQMRPADAGAVMQRLDAEVAADLLSQMAALPKPRKAVRP
ncbi:MAG TPA: hypothetical protein VND93_12190 [Myxococcales bacterium]|nr:hypothetical protein [Myxococcales bacterium]